MQPKKIMPRPVPDAASSRWLRRLPILLIGAGFVVALIYFRDVLSFDALARNRELLLDLRDDHFVLASLTFIAVYTLVVVLSLPGAIVLSLTGGFLFGLFPGAAYNVLSASIGAVGVFLAARLGFGADFARGIEQRGGVVARLQAQLRENQVWVLLTMRLMPVVPFFVTNILPAFVGVRLSVFVLTTVLGIIPAGVIYTSLGAGLGDIFARGEVPSLDIVLQPRFALPLIGLALLAALPLIIKLFARRKGEGMARIPTDLCIIGAGSGGLSLAAGAAQMGARVVLVEGAEMGGDCLNTGCVPSKAMLAAGKAAQARRVGGFGTAASDPQVDFAAAKDHVHRVIAQIAPVDSQERFEGLGVRVIRAWGRFISPTELQAGDDVISARRFVIATGSHALVPAIPGLDTVPYLTNETIFALRDRPAHLVIIGGGPIGMEMALAHRRLGSEVTVIEGARALGRDDPEAAAVVLARLRAEGVTIHEGQAVTEVAGNIAVTLADGRRIAGTHLMLAIGRKVALDRLNLDAAGVAFTPKGVTVDAALRSSNKRIFAVGDAAGGLQFTHVAGYHAGIVLRQAVLGLPARTRGDHIPWVTYTDPELAQIGLTEAEARASHGAALTVVRADFRHNDRAITEGHQAGFLKVMVVRGRPIGATCVGHGAGEVITLWSLVISQRLKMSAVAGMVSPYPTYGEISKRAAGAYFSPKLFDSAMVKRMVRLVQRWLP